MLQENKYFEESFQVYERGIALFKWPHVKDIWQAYLSQFVDRYKGTKLERARDLFKQALEKVSHPCLAPVHTLTHCLHAVTWLLHCWEASQLLIVHCVGRRS